MNIFLTRLPKDLVLRKLQAKYVLLLEHHSKMQGSRVKTWHLRNEGRSHSYFDQEPLQSQTRHPNCCRELLMIWRCNYECKKEQAEWIYCTINGELEQGRDHSKCMRALRQQHWPCKNAGEKQRCAMSNKFCLRQTPRWAVHNGIGQNLEGGQLGTPVHAASTYKSEFLYQQKFCPDNCDVILLNNFAQNWLQTRQWRPCHQWYWWPIMANPTVLVDSLY